MQVEKVGWVERRSNRRQRRVVQARSLGAREADRVAAELRAMGPEAAAFALKLVMANRLHMWADCPHQTCQRARACRGDDMLCFGERRPELKRKVIEEVVIMLCTAGVSSDEFYDYLDEVAAEGDEDGDCPET